ncbi:MAG: rod-binding protein [Planctomycetota bacterium]
MTEVAIGAVPEFVPRPVVPGGGGASGGTGAGFASALASAVGPAAASPDEARAAAEDLVAMTLIQPIFKQMRESPLMADGPFKPGAHEKTFQSMYDAELSQTIARASSLPITDAVFAQLNGGQANREVR